MDGAGGSCLLASRMIINDSLSMVLITTDGSQNCESCIANPIGSTISITPFLVFLLRYRLLSLRSLVNRASLNWVSTKPRPAHSDAIPFDPTMVFPDDIEVHAEASSNTSLAALIPDSTAPSIHACLSDVCSPAKWIRSWHFHTFSKSSFS